jgi:glyoxylase-like metal-dependent hydrolase (beta-lactamase superfamily II)
VLDTHMHADYLSGAREAARRWGVPYLLHPDDAVSPYDGTPSRLAFAPLSPGEAVRFGRATLRIEHRPGHTLGSVALVSDDGIALTGDFLFVASVGRPDLGERAEAWGRLLWRSLAAAREAWPGDLLVLPAHYAMETERRADRSVGARFDVIAATNAALHLPDETAFVSWLAQHRTPAPDAYRTLKLANLGLAGLSEQEAEAAEVGPNQCAVV